MQTPRLVITAEVIHLEPFLWYDYVLRKTAKHSTLTGTATFEVTWSYDLFEGTRHPDDPTAKEVFRWTIKDITFLSFEGPVEYRTKKGRLLSRLQNPERNITIVRAFLFEVAKHTDAFNPPPM